MLHWQGMLPKPGLLESCVTTNLTLQYLRRSILLDSGHNHHSDGAGQYRRGTRELLAIAMDRPSLPLDIYE